MYILTHWGTVHVLRHPNENSAQTQLVVVVKMPTTHANFFFKNAKKCKNQVLEKPAQQQNPHKTKTLKKIKQNMINTENVFRNGKKEEESKK